MVQISKLDLSKTKITSDGLVKLAGLKKLEGLRPCAY